MTEDVNKFRNSGGQRYTNGLFYETTLADKATVLYTLKDQDHKGYPSLYRLYMEQEDLTEWEFANTYLDGWEHWTMLCSSQWFKPYAERWRHELELKLKARALNSVREVAKGGGQNAYYANKFLLEGGWKEKDSSSGRGRGRPKKTKDATQEEILALEAKQRIKDDFERVIKE
jgi:hypothetical protein